MPPMTSIPQTMKTLLFTVLFIASLARAAGQTPAQIIEEYRSKAETACQKFNATLQAQGAAIAAELVAKGDTAGAADTSKQIEAKLKGEPVTSPHSAAATLFTQYDAARANALKPIKEASIQRIEAMLKTSAGKDMKVILELANVREEIEGGKSATPSTTAPQVGGKMPMKWDYYSDPSMQVINGELALNADGTLTLYGPPGTKAATPGTWQATDKRDIINVTLIRRPPESCVLHIKGTTATLERPIGTRFLKAK